MSQTIFHPRATTNHLKAKLLLWEIYLYQHEKYCRDAKETTYVSAQILSKSTKFLHCSVWSAQNGLWFWWLTVFLGFFKCIFLILYWWFLMVGAIITQPPTLPRTAWEDLDWSKMLQIILLIKIQVEIWIRKLTKMEMKTQIQTQIYWYLLCTAKEVRYQLNIQRNLESRTLICIILVFAHICVYLHLYLRL